VTLRFHPAAKDELIETADFYSAVRAGLGERFRDAVQSTLDRITAHPEIGVARNGVRRLVVDGFPYDVVYRVKATSIDVLAIAHHRRRPGYWRRRK